MNFSRKSCHQARMRVPYTHRFGSLLIVLLIAILDDVSRAATADVNHEHFDRQQDTEARQFGGFNANAAFNSNFASSHFGVNLGGSNSGVGNSPTTTSFNVPSYSTTSSPNNFNNFNSLNYNKNENKKKPYNDYSQQYPGTRTKDRFSHRYPDGSYEYRYELEDGTARYERGYFLLYDNKKSLVVVGYYSYRLTDGRYITVFYNADRNGYRQNQSITPQSFPNLPRSIEVPEYKFQDTEDDYHSKITTTANPRQTATTRRGGNF